MRLGKLTLRPFPNLHISTNAPRDLQGVSTVQVLSAHYGVQTELLEIS